jgi:hypothetical protein
MVHGQLSYIKKSQQKCWAANPKTPLQFSPFFEKYLENIVSSIRWL